MTVSSNATAGKRLCLAGVAGYINLLKRIRTQIPRCPVTPAICLQSIGSSALLDPVDQLIQCLIRNRPQATIAVTDTGSFEEPEEVVGFVVCLQHLLVVAYSSLGRNCLVCEPMPGDHLAAAGFECREVGVISSQHGSILGLGFPQGVEELCIGHIAGEEARVFGDQIRDPVREQVAAADLNTTYNVTSRWGVEGCEVCVFIQSVVPVFSRS